MVFHPAVRSPLVLVSPLLGTRVAWAARNTAFRGQWSLGDLISSLAVVAVLVGLIAFFFWPRRHS
jgi:ABC-type tungstate transport system substrate-binding protein